jgi:hypothetical protein
MRKVIFIFAAIFWYSTTIFAENKIDEATYYKLVDYVNCKYAIDYIEKDGRGNSDFITDFNRVKKKWTESVKSYQDVNHSYGEVSKIANRYYDDLKTSWNLIDAKKMSFNNSWTPKQIIDNLVQLFTEKPKEGESRYASFIFIRRDELITDLKKQLRGFDTPDIVEVTDDTKDTTEAKVEKKTSPTLSVDKKEIVIEKKPIKSKNFWRNLLFIIIIIDLMLFIYLRFKNHLHRLMAVFTKFIQNRKKARKNKISQKKALPKKKPKNKISELEERIMVLETKRYTIDAREVAMEILRNQYFLKAIRNELEIAINSFQTGNVKPGMFYIPERENWTAIVDTSVLYADAIHNGTFHRVTTSPTENTIFKINKNASGRTATFEVYKDAYEKVLRRPDFLEGCDLQKIDSQSVETFEIGKVELEYNTWKITEKAKIRFI